MGDRSPVHSGGSASVFHAKCASQNAGQVRYQTNELVSAGTWGQGPAAGAGLYGTRSEIRQNACAGHPPLAHADGLCRDPRQQKRGAYPG